MPTILNGKCEICNIECWNCPHYWDMIPSQLGNFTKVVGKDDFAPVSRRSFIEYYKIMNKL